MCKDERTYLLEQKCPNTTLDHKSAIVNLGETKPPSARIYLFCTNRQITPGKKWPFFISPPQSLRATNTNFAFRNISDLLLFAYELQNIRDFLNVTADPSLESVPTCVSNNTMGCYERSLFIHNCVIIILFFCLMASTAHLFFPWQDVFIYTVNFNELIQTGICLLADTNHLLQKNPKTRPKV